MKNSVKLSLCEDYMLHKGNENNDYYLINLVDGIIFQLNSVSYDFLSQCDGEKKLEEIINTLASMYDADKKIIERDFDDLIKKWVDDGIIINRACES